MSNKIKFSRGGDVGDFYEPSDSDGEYNEREKKLLKKVRTAGSRRDTETEQQVLAFDDQDDDDEADFDDAEGDEDDDDAYAQQNSDFEDGADADDGIPDERAWGRKRKDFYSTDFVDQDYSSYNTNEEQAAEQEEQEARAIQQRLAKQLDEADFTLDVFGGTGATPAATDASATSVGAEEHIQTDLSDLNQRERVQLFRKDSPEFAGLVADFEQRLEESQSVLEPVLAYFGGRGEAAKAAGAQSVVEFVQTKNNLILTYCSNVAFYLVLKAKRVNIKNHPLVRRLVQMRQLLLQLEERYDRVIRPQLEVLLERIAAGKELVFEATVAKPPAKPPKKSSKLNILKAMETKATRAEGDDDDDSADELDDTDLLAADKLVPADSDSQESAAEEDEDMGEDDERRQITYQMSKNKGLTPHRKKELRNPRVKHRNKFRKAIIRRKGAVRTVRTETKRYAGEQSGIKASTKKGIKIK